MDVTAEMDQRNWTTGYNGPVMPGGEHICNHNIVQHIQAANPEPYSIKVEKGQKNTYAWEIGIKGSDPVVIIEQIKAIDAQLKKEFMVV